MGKAQQTVRVVTFTKSDKLEGLNTPNYRTKLRSKVLSACKYIS